MAAPAATTLLPGSLLPGSGLPSRSSRLCMSSICRLRSSISPPSAGRGALLSASTAWPSRLANGANMAKVRWNISMFRRTCSSSGPKPATPNACATWVRIFSCSRTSVSIDTSRYRGTSICMLSP